MSLSIHIYPAKCMPVRPLVSFILAATGEAVSGEPATRTLYNFLPLRKRESMAPVTHQRPVYVTATKIRYRLMSIMMLVARTDVAWLVRSAKYMNSVLAIWVSAVVKNSWIRDRCNGSL